MAGGNFFGTEAVALPPRDPSDLPAPPPPEEKAEAAPPKLVVKLNAGKAGSTKKG